MLRFRGPGRAGRQGPGDRLCRLRLHGAVAAYRQLPHHDDAALAAAERQQADHPDGRRHHHGRRPLRQGRIARDPLDRRNRGQQGLDPRRVRQGAALRLRPQRRHHARQRRVADQAELDRDAARHRPAFLRQPHADDGLGAAPARARAGDELHRVQLHGLPGLRLRRAGAAHRLPAADGRLRPVGQHRQRRRSRPPHGHGAIVRADDAAADDRLGRQDGQDRAGRGLAQRRPVLALTISGNTGATSRTPTSSSF